MKKYRLIIISLFFTSICYAQMAANQKCEVIFYNNSATQLTLKTKHHQFQIPANGKISGHPNCDKLIAKKNLLMGTHTYAGYTLKIDYSSGKQTITYILTGKPATSVKCGVGNCSNPRETRISIGGPNSICVPCPTK